MKKIYCAILVASLNLTSALADKSPSTPKKDEVKWCGVGYIAKIIYNMNTPLVSHETLGILLDSSRFPDIRQEDEKYLKIEGTLWIAITLDTEPSKATDKQISDFMSATSVIESAFYSHTPVAIRALRDGKCYTSADKFSVIACSQVADCRSTETILKGHSVKAQSPPKPKVSDTLR
ncbi:TPA: hypothetical protein ACXNHW_004811 [Pseudomonas aeruginosa]